MLGRNGIRRDEDLMKVIWNFIYNWFNFQA